MTTKFRKSFRKDCKKLMTKEEQAWFQALRLLDTDYYHPKLRRHKLAGEYIGLESIDVTPDLRAVFFQDGDLFTFYYLRNHNQLYG